ncbi:RHS repeat-associated core domain-containing protein [Leifsonia virtsii]|uniref:RHS repeat-associated core domain-containing protein n=1 Tax=Leifsonia virtsii TaxID=3035915 RepID=A0ABT8J3Q9_9MICO|nr:RHS repeat-associated core domain-containing protein [Leifsonia virtsii]MDN4598904.1 RHS repeat-associated core domain-containing protein [Leifsonia virtsii]
MLDPDNDEGIANTPAPRVSELGYNVQLAQRVRTLLQQDCQANVVLTREDPAVPFISRATRAGIAAAANPTLTLGIGFNTNQGTAWGAPSNGGSQVYSRGGAVDDAVSNSLVGVLPTYTTRPAKNLGNNGNFPGDEFAGLPNAFTHLEALFMDHNYDRPVIDNGMPSIANGVLTGLGVYLESQGFDCTDPVTGGWPSPPSQAEIARWRQLGHQNHQTYGGEPFSFSTGNLIEDEKLFTLPGAGGSATDITFTYNSQDGRLTRIGAGWSFGLGVRAQRFIDGSVMVVRGDGASFVFTGDGKGGYTTADAGVHQTLTEAGGGKLRLTDVSGESWLFDASNIDGIGNLIAHTDAAGHTTTLTYGAPNPDVNQFYPLTSITDSSGQTITVDSDAVGRVTGFTRPGGDHWSLGYDAAGNLTSITKPDGRSKSFTYDDKHQLLAATDATGALYLKNEYDAQGRVVKQWDVQGNLRRLDYSTPGQTTYTDNLGRKSVYSYDDQSRITKVQHPDGTTAVFGYDDDNNVTRSTDENGQKTAYTYDAAGNLLTQTAPDGVVTKYTYTPTGLVATKTDTGGKAGAERTWAYDYDAAGHVVAVHQPDGTTLANTFDSAGNLTATTQPSGARTTFGYDAAGHLTTATDANGHATTYAYDAAGRMASQTDPNGHTTRYSWDSGDRVVTVSNAAGGVFSYGWEPNDHLASLTDPLGGVTKYSWDAMFHLTDTTSPTGGVTKYDYTAEDALAKQTDPLGGTTSYATDDQDRTVKTVDPNGGEWTYTYDGVGNLTASTSPAGAKTTYTYDSNGQLTSQTDPTGGKSTYSYDSVGRLVKQTDPDGVATRYGYDLLDRVSRITDGLGKHTDLAYDIDGNLTSVTDRQGNVTTYAYDPAGQVVSQTTPLGETTRYGYDPDGNVITVTDPLGRTTGYAYDALEQLTARTDPAGNTTSYRYDADGRTTAVTDPNGHTTKYAYDAAGNNTSTTDPTGAVTAYRWDADGNQTSLVDASGHVTRYGHDPAGQLTTVTEEYKAGAKPGQDVNVVSTYGYDPDGNLTTVTDPNGHATKYTADRAGRTLSEVNPVGNTTTWAYTAAGRPAKTTTGTGATIGYGYNVRGDLTRQDQAGAAASYEYDAEQRLIAMTDPTGVSGFTYDKDGRLTTQIDQQGGHLTTAYDKAGQTTSMTLPTGQTLDYTYDTAGRVTSQASPWGSLSYGWDPAGNLTKLARSTGVTTTYGYDPDNRVTDVLHTTLAAAAAPATATPTPTPTPAAYVSGDAAAAQCETVAGYLSSRSASAAGSNGMCKHTAAYLGDRTLPAAANPVPDGGSLRFTYAYAPDGNLTDATRTITGGAYGSGSAPGVVRKTSKVYGYDNLDRLTSSVIDKKEKNTYAYDPAGNRTGWTRSGATDGDFTQTATYNNANQVTQTATDKSGRGVSAGVATYGYDGAGNRTSQSVAGVGASYAYNAVGQTSQVTRDGRTTSYGYDGLGRQASITDQTKYGTDTTRNVYNGGDLAQTASVSHGTSTLVSDAIGQLAEHVTATGSATWDLLDGLGSTVAGATGGSITQLASYDDWGTQVFETTGWSAPQSYTGQAGDPTQGLVHNSARSYDPATGSWTSPETWRGLLTQPKTLARYQYVSDNPATYLDPDGHLCARRGAGDGLPLGCGAPPVQAYNNVKMPPPAPPYVPKKKDTPKPKGPGTQTKVQERHADGADFVGPNLSLTANRQICGPGVAPTICAFINGNSEKIRAAQHEAWVNETKDLAQTFGNIAAGIDFVTLVFPALSPLTVPAAVIVNAGSVALSCGADWNTRNCLLGGFLFVSSLGLASAGSIKALPGLSGAMLRGAGSITGSGSDVGTLAGNFDDGVSRWWDQKVFG